mmetsp:Transcript_27187/g.78126  ORF Transcript_27187/g.78126 Transcript_27187/m.78126 type:complete len:208 (-) Transcript_27187:592-1215(-)
MGFQLLRSAAARARPLMHADLQIGLLLARLAAEGAILVVDPLHQLPHHLHRFVVTRLVRGAHAQHQLVGALPLLRSLEEARTFPSKPQLRPGCLCDGLHVLPVRSKHLSCDLELAVFFDPDEELTLRLRRAGDRTTAVGLLEPGRVPTAVLLLLLLRPPVLLRALGAPPFGILGAPPLRAILAPLLLRPPCVAILRGRRLAAGPFRG